MCLPFFSLLTMCSLVCGFKASMWITRSLRLCVLRLLGLGFESAVAGNFGGTNCGFTGSNATLLPADFEKLGGGSFGLLGLRKAAGTGLTLSTD